MKPSAAIWAVIPAAGVGKRMQADCPKQYMHLLDKTVIEHTLSVFSQHPKIAGIVIVLHPKDPYWSALKLQIDKPLYVVDGGKERCDSVLNALDFLSERVSASDWVMVHDAARPCLQRQELDLLIDQLYDDEVGGILAVPVSDTMKRACSVNVAALESSQQSLPRIRKTEDREALWHAFTPQMFRLAALRSALKMALAADITITDEASAMENAQLKPRLIEGYASNIKITRPADLHLAAFFLQGE